MRSYKPSGPSYRPKVWDIVKVDFPGSQESVYGMVVHAWGSSRQGKINVMCKSGPKSAVLHLIWKESTGWFCYFNGIRYEQLGVAKYEGNPPSFLKQ